MSLTHKNRFLVIYRELKRLHLTAKILTESIKDLEDRVKSMLDDRPKEINLCGLRITRRRKSRDSYFSESSFQTDLVSMPSYQTEPQVGHYAEPNA